MTFPELAFWAMLAAMLVYLFAGGDDFYV